MAAAWLGSTTAIEDGRRRRRQSTSVVDVDDDDDDDGGDGERRGLTVVALARLGSARHMTTMVAETAAVTAA